MESIALTLHLRWATSMGTYRKVRILRQNEKDIRVTSTITINFPLTELHSAATDQNIPPSRRFWSLLINVMLM